MSISCLSYSSQGEKGSEGEPGRKVSRGIKMLLLTGGSQILGVPIIMIDCVWVVTTCNFWFPIHLSTARKYDHFLCCFPENSFSMSSFPSQHQLINTLTLNESKPFKREEAPWRGWVGLVVASLLGSSRVIALPSLIWVMPAPYAQSSGCHLLGDDDR